EAETDRRAIVEDVDRISIQADRLRELIDDLGEVIKGIGELFAIGRLREAEAGQIGCDDVIALGENRDKVAKHVRGSGKSVQEKDGGSVSGSSLTIEDTGITDVGIAVVGHTTSLTGSERSWKIQISPAHLQMC